MEEKRKEENTTGEEDREEERREGSCPVIMESSLNHVPYLECCATNRKVASSIAACVITIFH